MATIKDVARMSGAGIATVSRVINNNGYVSEETRQRIQKAIDESGYRPNVSARMMRNGRSNLIGILVPSIKVDFFSRLVYRLEKALFDQGYQTLICSTGENLVHEHQYIEMLLAQQVDGVMVASVSSNIDAFEKLVNANIPVLALDRDLEGMDVTLVSCDHLAGGRTAAQHLIDLGHTQISVVGAPKQSEPIKQRLAGVQQACKASGLDNPENVLGSDHSVQGCAELALQVLNRKQRPSAVVGTSDIAAIGILHAARAANLGVPSELSVTGFDDTPMAAHVFPALTTIAQPIDQLAEEAISALVARIKTPDMAVQSNIILPCSLSLRQSTAAAR
ncbi:UNVERIFIED_CONTAM: hypothetical protein GTU68_011771 [Idotea baltica]|nr:hypothetical protein [Idotea baltica]